MKIKAAVEMIRKSLIGKYSADEIESFIALIFEHLLNLSRIKVHLRQQDFISEAKLIELNKIVERLQNFEPIQYILGETEFYGLKLKVNPSVLIPRPETEELVEWILKDAPPQYAKLIDMGTGSGCIPIAIAANRPDLRISACDISTQALLTAQANASLNKVKLELMEMDILDLSSFDHDENYDIIVSNPPYVTRSEEALMSKNVTDHEPSLALFVPDEDALIFYNAIAEFALRHLNSTGALYFEINERMGYGVEQLLKQSFSNVEIRQDIFGKDRMIKAVK